MSLKANSNTVLKNPNQITSKQKTSEIGFILFYCFVFFYCLLIVSLPLPPSL